MTTNSVLHKSVNAVTSPSHASFCMVSEPAHHGETVYGTNERGNCNE